MEEAAVHRGRAVFACCMYVCPCLSRCVCVHVSFKVDTSIYIYMCACLSVDTTMRALGRETMPYEGGRLCRCAKAH